MSDSNIARSKTKSVTSFNLLATCRVQDGQQYSPVTAKTPHPENPGVNTRLNANVDPRTNLRCSFIILDQTDTLIHCSGWVCLLILKSSGVWHWLRIQTNGWEQNTQPGIKRVTINRDIEIILSKAPFRNASRVEVGQVRITKAY